MRLPYVADPPIVADAESQAIVDRVRARRVAGGHDGLVELDRALLHSPPVADGWNSLLGAVRTQTTLPAHIRELIICRVAALNSAAYEWIHHEPILRKALQEAKEVFAQGTSEDDIETATKSLLHIIRRKEPDQARRVPELDESFVPLFRAILNYVDAMTDRVHVGDWTWDELRKACKEGPEGDREAVEITALCAAYNCVSRFLVALNVGEASWSDVPAF